MKRGQMTLAECWEEAQRLGYAECLVERSGEICQILSWGPSPDDRAGITNLNDKYESTNETPICAYVETGWVLLHPTATAKQSAALEPHCPCEEIAYGHPHRAECAWIDWWRKRA